MGVGSGGQASYMVQITWYSIFIHGTDIVDNSAIFRSFLLFFGLFSVAPLENFLPTPFIGPDPFQGRGSGKTPQKPILPSNKICSLRNQM